VGSISHYDQVLVECRFLCIQKEVVNNEGGCCEYACENNFLENFLFLLKCFQCCMDLSSITYAMVFK